MPFQLSPGVNVSEIDLTNVVPAVSTTEGALAGVFRWGPVGERVLVDSEAVLAARFGKPTNHNAETFFTGANFLAYGNKLYVVRAANTTSTDENILARNSVANTGIITDFANGEASAAKYVIKNEDHWTTTKSIETGYDTDVVAVGRYPGELGNSLKIVICANASVYTSNTVVDAFANGDTIDANVGAFTVAATVGSNTITVAAQTLDANSTVSDYTVANTAINDFIDTFLNVGDYIVLGNTTIGEQVVRVTNTTSTAVESANVVTRTFSIADKFQLAANFTANLEATTIQRRWEYASLFDQAPGRSQWHTDNGNTSLTTVDEVHIAVLDEDGMFTGTPGTVLESYASLSRATDAKTPTGEDNYWKSAINNQSNYVWILKDNVTTSPNTAINLTNTSQTDIVNLSFANGTDGKPEGNVEFGVIASGYDFFNSTESTDVSLILQGKARSSTEETTSTAANVQVQLANYLIDNIADVRRDCVVFASPPKYSVVSNAGSETTDVVSFRDSVTSSSYGVLDSGYKYQYDKYNDVYRWIPLNGDTAGLCVRTDTDRDPWFSPAGFNRGQIKNIIKLAYNPTKAHRDTLYKNGVNPVVAFPGQGTILYGDKTLQAKPGAFDRINVRRLFITLEKAIATAAQFTLFEFNDEFTRAQFRNLVEPFLRDVQGRRGIYDFKVVCDDTNNTGEVIDRNEFVGDIYIKPAKSINFIQLNFVAVKTGVEFSEVVGQF